MSWEGFIFFSLKTYNKSFCTTLSVFQHDTGYIVVVEAIFAPGRNQWGKKSVCQTLTFET